MRVTHLHPTPGAVGGSEVALQLAVAELGQRQVRSAIVCAEVAEHSGFVGDVEVICSPETFVNDPALAPVIRRRAERLMGAVAVTQPDVVHVHLGVRPALVEYLAQRWPTVYTAQVPVCPNGARHLYAERVDCDAAVGLKCLTAGYRKHGCGHLSDGTPTSALAFARAIRSTDHLLRALSRCAVVIAPSRWQATRLAADGLSSQLIRVVHPPVQPCEPGLAEDPPVVAFAGRLVAFKGADHLLTASRRVSARHQVWVIGDGPERSKLEGVAKEGGGWAVRFWGAIAPGDVASVLGRASVVVVPSLWGEVFNMVGAQAAVGGVPVVGYDVGGMRDWADAHEHAKLVPVGDVGALADAIAAALSSGAGSEVVADGCGWSVGEHAERLLSVYREAASARAGS